ncbi:DUF1540 domain-containing protein [Propionicicella superfundia]|uniref:DUF1540 domain-containing protein n=1 Tax=Propionicicella superfundia TaxID=348582 RepID=UPI00048DF625|nr:DUF1540 domain-containing protein [Propionicicella superfundia]
MSAATAVKSCAVSACAYNNGGCTAFAVTIGGAAGKPSCGTFVALDARGGLVGTQGVVGACQRLECVHNNDLMCSVDAIEVGGDAATCQVYEVR